ISPEQIADLRKIAGEMEDLELTHRAFAQKLGERHFDFDERAAIKDCMNSVLNHNKMPFFLAITLLKEALAMLEILWADTKLYSNKVGIIAPRSEMDAATLVVWEILEVLGVSPRDHYGALAMHYLGYEELLPNGRDKDSCSIVNRWSTRHSRAKAKRPEVYARLKNILDKVKLS
ncbi:MAG: hypothetical protein O3B73_13755, partial [bacterium]|nr:hypothetical protein [bacterium]